MFCRHVFGNISGGFRGISRFLGNFAGFRGNTLNSQVHDGAKYQKPWNMCLPLSIDVLVLYKFLRMLYSQTIFIHRWTSVHVHNVPSPKYKRQWLFTGKWNQSPLHQICILDCILREPCMLPHLELLNFCKYSCKHNIHCK